MLFQIGILTPQGGFDVHKERLEEAYGDAAEVHDAGSLWDLSGLILSGEDPGTLREALQASNLFEPLREFGRQRPILATGAAVCLVVQESLGLMNIGVDCAGYEGRIDRLTESLRHEFDDESGALRGRRKIVCLRGGGLPMRRCLSAEWS
jgi:glutamine amidotransferase PdxT